MIDGKPETFPNLRGFPLYPQMTFFPRVSNHARAKLLAICLLTPVALCSAQNAASKIEFFESKIRPALVEHCYECHSKEAGEAKGGLLLDSRESLLLGGDSGAAIVPGSPRESLLTAAISYQDSSLEMPPKYKLDEAVIADIKEWIGMGAPDPRESSEAGMIYSVIDVEAGRDFWAYQKPTQGEIPEFPEGSWPISNIDRYIYDSLEQAGLHPVEDAAPASLLRRLYYDLIGLPPEPNMVEAFIKACSKDKEAAVSAVVDDLLASPRFGERWGRHWLDIARYAESNGRDVNVVYYPEAWRYRDYVIKSFNEDKPYDVFLTEQIAGDQMSSAEKTERAQQGIATGFLALGPKNLNAKNEQQFRYDLVDEQIQTLGKAILGTTISCARCHDHKFDPIPQSDYYAMAGIFLSSETWYGTYSSVQNRHSSELIELPIEEKQYAFDPLTANGLEAKKAQLSRAQESIRKIKGELFRARSSGGNGPNASQRRKLLQLNHVITMLELELDTYDEDGKPIALAMGMTDSDEIADASFLVRGEVDLPKGTVPRGFLQVMSEKESHVPIAAASSGRLELAKWIASPGHPLTARVMANRIWMHLMGNGIVKSVDNFGSTGSKPTHPGLLDYLALQFVDHGWSVKEIIREIVQSRAYQLSSEFDNTNFLADPDNALRWRADKRRLDAESLRDSLLSFSRALEINPPYGSVIAEQSRNIFGGGIADIDGFEFTSPHRSVYLPIIRKQVPDSLDIFDFADPGMAVGKRETTTVPSQALFLLNSDFVRTQAAAMAYNLIKDDRIAPSEQGTRAFLLVYGRHPTEDEMEKSKLFFQQALKLAEEKSVSERTDAYQEALTDFCHALCISADFLYVN